MKFCVFELGTTNFVEICFQLVTSFCHHVIPMTYGSGGGTDGARADAGVYMRECVRVCQCILCTLVNKCHLMRIMFFEYFCILFCQSVTVKLGE